MNRFAACDEIEFLKLVSIGDEPSFREVYDRYHQKVYSLSFFLTRSHTIAEDLTQEIFVKIWTNREDLPNINQFEGWLKVLVRNHAYNYLNKMAREKRLLRDEKLTTNLEANFTEDVLTDKELNLLLHNAVDKLPPQQKKIYQLSRQDGLKLDAIAQAMGLSINTVKNHLKAALSKIRISLGAHTLLLILSLMLYWQLF